MATFRDPVRCFAPLEVVERVLEIRTELGYEQTVYMPSPAELVDFFDAHGFDVYAFSTGHEEINFGDYRSPFVPGGDNVHTSVTAH
ncbi:MAG: hypothetical protein R2681_04025 [Pyrinomonadaceae bacterium]